MTAYTSDKNGNLIELYRYESPIGDTEPTGLQAAARLASDKDRKIAELVLAAVAAAGQLKIMEDLVWDYSRNFDAVHDSERVRAELLSKVREFSRE